MGFKQILTWNSIIWAVVMFPAAVLLKGESGFIGVLIVLICGAVASDAIIARDNSR